MRKFLVLAVACASLSLLGSGTALSAAAPRSPALEAFRGAWSAVHAYSTTITVFEQKGASVQNVVFKYTFRRPSTVTVDVVGGTNDGVSLLWSGGPTVIAHKGGFLGIFKKTMGLHDPEVVTIRGSSIDELGFAEILAYAEETPGAITQAPGLTINEIDTDAVTLTPVHPVGDAGYTREVIELSRTTHFPTRVLGYHNSTLVRKIDFMDVKLSY